jgi:hypothetical protein
MEELGVNVIFNDRVIEPEEGWSVDKATTFHTRKGKEIVADHVVSNSITLSLD